jgi:hypothetical protein
MADKSNPRRTSPMLWAAGVALLVPIILPLLVGTYAKTDPKLGDIPFFFWYQFALIPVSALLTLLAYKLVTASDAERRASSHDQSRGDS